MDNQIESIQKLYAKDKTYKIPKEPKEGHEQVSLTVTQLSLEDLGLLNIGEDMPLSELSKNVKTMVAKSLRITEEEAGKISFEFMEELLEVVMDVNNFKDEEAKKTGIKDFIKKKQEQIKKKEDNGESNKSA